MRGIETLMAEGKKQKPKAKTFKEVAAIIAQVRFKDREIALMVKGDGFLLQVQYCEEDIHTGRMELQKARKWYVSPWSTETEIVETCFKALRVSNDHVLKEGFTYKGRRVYSPHFDVNARIDLCDKFAFDRRPDDRGGR